MKPSPGYAFIIEDQKDSQSKSGIVIEHRNKSKGAMGKIYAVNPTVICPHCQASVERTDLNVGDHVIYSRFVGECIDYKEEGMPEGRLFAVPVDAILAHIA